MEFVMLRSKPSQSAAAFRAPRSIVNTNSLITYALVFTSVLICSLLFVDWIDRTEEPDEKQPFYYYQEGKLNVSQAYCVHLVTALDLLVRLTPLQGDPDLLISTDSGYDQVLRRLPQVHRTKCLPNIPLYQFEVVWDELSRPGDGALSIDVHRFFSLQSSSFGIEEIPVLRDYPHDLSVRKPRPLLLVVRAYPGAYDVVRFRLEVFPHRPSELRYEEIRKVVDEGSLSFEELAMRYATFPETSDSFDDLPSSSTPKESTSRTLFERLGNGLRSFEPVVSTILEGVFDALL
ncbi:hypothetical protein CRM22_008417 [Opisthorchis felineus]|uniref:Uncharacterized protein n=1 Tax=Opisthorchis felineus TaxID=147828 RepID=A0A4S2LIE6_OPIFE|nr:hypothetical protein CRM22_008417 [Opisthorchis felineus]